jgi:hypothetical protein
MCPYAALPYHPRPASQHSQPLRLPACCPFPQRLSHCSSMGALARLVAHDEAVASTTTSARPPARPAVQLVHCFAFRSIAVGPSCSRRHRRSQTRRWPLTAAARLPGTPSADMGFPVRSKDTRQARVPTRSQTRTAFALAASTCHLAPIPQDRPHPCERCSIVRPVIATPHAALKFASAQARWRTPALPAPDSQALTHANHT